MKEPPSRTADPVGAAMSTVRATWFVVLVGCLGLMGCAKNGAQPSRCAAVVCKALDACHDVGVCNPSTGLCSDPPVLDGASCSGAGTCTGEQRCRSGVCICTPANATLVVRVTRIGGFPVPGASVAAAGAFSTSGAGGEAVLSLPAGHIVAQVAAAGFAHATAVLDVESGASFGTTVVLLPQGDPSAFLAETGAAFSTGEVSVTVPGGALVEAASGQPVTGSVDLRVTPLDPTGPQIAAAPGPLRALAPGGGSVDVASLFMAEVGFSQGGKPLQISPGKSITLAYRLPAALQGSLAAGNIIPAYHYDESAGSWVEEGAGTIVSDGAGLLAWRAQVSHVTWWGANQPWIDGTCARVHVTDAHGAPVPFAPVTIDIVGFNGWGSGSGMTNAHDFVACVDFLRTARTVTVGAFYPLYPPCAAPSPGTNCSAYPYGNLAGLPVAVSQSWGSASCSGPQSGSCVDLAVQLPGISCVRGILKDSSGAPVSGATVLAEGDTFSTDPALTDSSGSFCLSVPQNSNVRVRGAFQVETNVSTGPAEMFCPTSVCTDAGTLTLPPPFPRTTCFKGRLWSQNPTFPRPPAVGQRVLAYSGVPRPVCDGVPAHQDPTTWAQDGRVLGSALSDSSGRFCMDVPVQVDGNVAPWVLEGDCGVRQTPSCLHSFFRPWSVPAGDPARSCALGNCIDIGDVDFSGC